MSHIAVTESQLSPLPQSASPGSTAAGVPEISLQHPAELAEGDAGQLTPWLERLVAELAPDAVSFAARFVDDAEMRVFNRDYRGQDKTTDVLSFPGGETPEGLHLGDVVISLPTAARQARQALGGDLPRELRRLLLHGVLHCLGYDHESDEGEMDEIEARLRREWL